MQNAVEKSRPLSLARIREGLLRYSPRDLVESSGMANAAVALILREDGAGESEVLMIRRAEHPQDPWAGHMGFPGGRVDPGDESPRRAVVRETEEELGLRLDTVAQPIGRLSEVHARCRFEPIPLTIFPFLFELTTPAPLHLNEEAVEAVWIPLSFFLQRENRIEMKHRLTHDRSVSCCLFAGRIIWGLSLGMVDELLFEVLRAER